MLRNSVYGKIHRISDIQYTVVLFQHTANINELTWSHFFFLSSGKFDWNRERESVASFPGTTSFLLDSVSLCAVFGAEACVMYNAQIIPTVLTPDIEDSFSDSDRHKYQHHGGSQERVVKPMFLHTVVLRSALNVAGKHSCILQWNVKE